jgi:hypothetical protein
MIHGAVIHGGGATAPALRANQLDHVFELDLSGLGEGERGLHPPA